MGDNAPGTYHAAVSDCHSRHNLDSCAKPHVVANVNRLVLDQPGVSEFCINGMHGCVEAAAWAHKDVVSEDDLGAVKNSKTVVGYEVFPYLYIVPVIAPQGRIYHTTFPDFS